LHQAWIALRDKDIPTALSFLTSPRANDLFRICVFAEALRQAIFPVVKEAVEMGISPWLASSRDLPFATLTGEAKIVDMRQPESVFPIDEPQPYRRNEYHPIILNLVRHDELPNKSRTWDEYLGEGRNILRFLMGIMRKEPPELFRRVIGINTTVSHYSLLHVAARVNDTRTLSFLLDHCGMDPLMADINNLNRRPFRGTPFSDAASYGAAGSLRVLFKHIKNLDESIIAEQKWRSEYIAVRRGKIKILQELERLGVDFSFKPKARGYTSLHLVSEYGQKQTAEWLINHGANLEVPDNKGNTPLMQAIVSGQEEMVPLFWKHGADFRVRDRRGETPFLLASRYGRYHVIRFMLDHKLVDFTERNKQGKTALDLTITFHHISCLREILIALYGEELLSRYSLNGLASYLCRMPASKANPMMTRGNKKTQPCPSILAIIADLELVQKN
jgi:hypothetical protein